MKKFAAILSFYILFISAIPVLQMGYSAFHPQEKCCGKCCMEMSRKNPAKKCNSCKETGCAICQQGCCPFCGFPVNVISVSKISIERKIKVEYFASNFISQYSSDCFRPPEIA